MAVIKRLKTEHNTIVNDNLLIRNRFDRFDDYLVEQLTKYLSFDDKLKFQFISKQWMRTVFHRQNELDLKPIFFKLFQYYYLDINGNEHSILNAIECMLKTCSEIKKINVDFRSLRFADTTNRSFLKKLLVLLADNCKNLQSFYLSGNCSSNAFDKNLWQYFGEKCGEKTHNADISSLGRKDCQIFLRNCPNLVSLEKIKLINLMDTNIGDAFAPKLSEIKILFVGQNGDSLDLFATKYASTMKRLGIDLHNNNNNKSSNSCLSHISKLTNLEILWLRLNDKTLIGDSLVNIATNCSKLFSLRLALECVRKNDKTCKKIMKSLKHFARLNKLIIVTRSVSGDCSAFWDHKLLLPKLFRKCEHLTHLIIRSNIGDSFFNDIDKYLPQLKVLKIETYFWLIDKSLHCLAKLSELKVLVIIKKVPNGENSKFTDEGVCDVIDSCPQLQSIVFKPIPQITMKTIDKIIEVAIDRLDTSFYYYFEPTFDRLNSVQYGKYTQSIIDGINSLCCLPKNLRLVVE